MTTTHTGIVRNPVNRLLLFLALIALGLAGNYFKFSILNADFIFGSVFAMLALQFLGLSSGIVAATIISSYTYLVWNHPFAILTMTAEVAFVGWAISRRKINMVSADAIYWLIVGIPVGYMCFYFIVDLPSSNALFLMTKQAINGVANCVIARLIFTGYSVRSQSSLISLHELVSNLLVFFALSTGLAIMAFGSRTDFENTDQLIRTLTIKDSREQTYNIQRWLEDKQALVVNLASVTGIISPTQSQSYLEHLLAADTNFSSMAIVDIENKTIASYPTFDESVKNIVGSGAIGFPEIMELKQELQPMLKHATAQSFGVLAPTATMIAPIISGGKYKGYVAGGLNLDRIRESVEMNFIDEDTKYILVDKDGKVIITNSLDQMPFTSFSRGKGTLDRIDENISQWIPELAYRTSTIELWGKSLYVVESDVGRPGGWKLILEQPVAKFQKNLYDKYSARISILFMVVIALLALAEVSSRRMFSTIEKLARITLDLPAKLASQLSVVWPKSATIETNHLISNFREMANSLSAKFTEIRQINESLESAVKQRTHELKTSQDKLSTAMETARLGHWDYDIINDLFTFNDHFYRLFHTNAEQVGGYTMSSAEYARRFVHPEDVSVVGEEIQKALEATDPHYSRLLEHRIIYADGTVGHILVRFLTIQDDDGITIKTYGVNLDITEQKIAEQEIRNSEQRFRTLFETASDAIFILDIEGDNAGKILSANKAAAYMHRYTIDELLTLNISDLYAPESAAQLPERIERILRGETIKEEATHQRKDGSTFPIEINASLLILENHKYSMSVDRDITERKAAETALRKSEERYRQLSDVSFEAIIFHDNGILLEANDQFFEMFGYNRDELTGKQIIDKTISPQSIEMVKRHIATGSAEPYEAIGLKKDGTTFPITTRTRFWKTEGKEVLAVAIRDISDLRRLETQYLQSQKMEAVGTLAGGIAHDFNNLLQTVLGYSEFMLQRKKEGEPDYADLQKIYQAGKRGADLVKNLLTFSRRVDTHYLPIDLNQEITAVRGLLSRTIPKTININLHLSGNLEYIKADPSQISQVLMNLGVNARDAMPDGGTLTIETTGIQLDEKYCNTYPEAKPGNYVLLTISDTGQGMDNETLSHIFEPFFSTKEVGKGTGLGLATVYGIVKHHQGRIICYSELGHGTTFKIYLPAIQTKKELETTTIEKAIAGGTETVLLVDDDDDIRDLVATFLIEFGYSVITAVNGKEAVEMYQRERESISLVILDLVMPVMDGSQCLAQIRRIDPKARVVIASGYSEGGTANGVMMAGANGFVQKPYNMRQLLTTVREILDKD